MRLIPAGVAVLAWAKYQGKSGPSGLQAWLACLAFGIVDGTMFQGFLAEGLQHVPAGVGSVIIDSQPLTVALVAALLFGESLTPLGVGGLLLGIFGLLLLELPADQLQSVASLDFGARISLKAMASCQCAQLRRPILQSVEFCLILPQSESTWPRPRLSRASTTVHDL